MKKIKVSIAIFCIAIIFIISCQKDKTLVNSNPKKVKSSSTAQKTVGLKSSGYGGTYVLSSHVGHTAAQCSNSCSVVNGVKRHLSCQSFGNICNFVANINISKVLPDNNEDPYYNAIGVNSDEPTTENTFMMPARSFYIENNNFENGYIWLNIPEQTLVRNNENEFIYYNITFTSEILFDDL